MGHNASDETSTLGLHYNRGTQMREIYFALLGRLPFFRFRSLGCNFSRSLINPSSFYVPTWSDGPYNEQSRKDMALVLPVEGCGMRPQSP